MTSRAISLDLARSDLRQAASWSLVLKLTMTTLRSGVLSPPARAVDGTMVGREAPTTSPLRIVVRPGDRSRREGRQRRGRRTRSARNRAGGLGRADRAKAAPAPDHLRVRAEQDRVTEAGEREG